MYKQFIDSFTDKCFFILENTARVNIDDDGDQVYPLNARESFSNFSMTSTFSKFLSRLSSSDFDEVVKRLHHYFASKFLEPQVAGTTFCYMLQGAANVQPDEIMDLFIPLICSKIQDRLAVIQEGENRNEVDKELQFYVKTLSYLFMFERSNVVAKPLSASKIEAHLDLLCQILDKTLSLKKYDEYFYPADALATLMHNMLHVRPIPCSSIDFGKSYEVEDIKVEWYVPNEKHLNIIQRFLDKFLIPELDLLDKWTDKAVELNKDEMNKIMCKIRLFFTGVNEVLPFLNHESNPTNFDFFKSLEVKFKCGEDIKQRMLTTLFKVQDSIIERTPDDTKSLRLLLQIYGHTINRYMSYRSNTRVEKNYLVRNKKHLLVAHMSRIYNKHVQIDVEKHDYFRKVPNDLIKRIFHIAMTSKYQNLRLFAKNLLTNIFNNECYQGNQMYILSILKESLKSDVPLYRCKSALGIINGIGLKTWKSAAVLFPELLQVRSDEKTEDKIQGQLPITDYINAIFPVVKVSLFNQFLPVKPTILENGSEQDQDQPDDEDFVQLRNVIIKSIRTENLPKPLFSLAMRLLKKMQTADQDICVDVFNLWLDHINYPDDEKIRKSAISVSCILMLIAKVA